MRLVEELSEHKEIAKHVREIYKNPYIQRSLDLVLLNSQFITTAAGTINDRQQ